jgi:prepilin signal peptidase PulO-like enzyme (type II secretory pathway)
MIICGLTDLDRMILHLPVMLLLGGIGLILSLTSFWPVIAIGAILGMMTLMLVLSAINKMYRCWRRTDDFGDSDIWLMGAVCCWLGPISAVIVF